MIGQLKGRSLPVMICATSKNLHLVPFITLQRQRIELELKTRDSICSAGMVICKFVFFSKLKFCFTDMLIRVATMVISRISELNINIEHHHPLTNTETDTAILAVM